MTTTIPTDPSCGPERLFVALPVPAPVAANLGRLPRKGLDARWVNPSDLHITLRFLDSVPPEKRLAVEAALALVRRPPFAIEIDGLDAFQPAGGQSVLYARIASVRKVTTLCAEITDILTPLGFDFGMRPYVPHLTLARVRHGDVRDYIARSGSACRGRWMAGHFALMQSTAAQTQGDADYLSRRSYELR